MTISQKRKLNQNDKQHNYLVLTRRLQFRHRFPSDLEDIVQDEPLRLSPERALPCPSIGHEHWRQPVEN